MNNKYTRLYLLGLVTTITLGITYAYSSVSESLTYLRGAGDTGHIGYILKEMFGTGGTSTGKIKQQYLDLSGYIQGVVSVNSQTGIVVLDKTDIGLGNVQNVNQTNASNLTSGTVGLARLPIGTISATGVVKLNSATNSASTTEAATPSAVKAAYDLANAKSNDTDVVKLTGNQTVAGIKTFTNEVVSTSANSYRIVQGSYGAFFRSTGTSFYLLYTASGSQNGTYNSLRPFTSNIETGNVSLGNNALYVEHFGNVGIGTITPAYKLDVVGNVNMSGVIGIGTATPTTGVGVNLGLTSSNGSYKGINNAISVSGTFGAGRTNYGINNRVTNTAVNGTYTNTLYGDYTNIDNNSSSTTGTNNMYATYSMVENLNNGNIGSSFGIYARSLNNTAGVISNAYGVYGYAQNNNAGGSITNAYGGRFNVTQSAGTITNGYGIRIDDISATNAYGIYQASTSDMNYFAGNIGIGQTAPTAPFQIGDGIFIGEGGLNGSEAVGSDIRFSSYGLISADSGFQINIGGANTTTNSAFTIAKDSYTNTATPIFTVYESGNIGIGTTTPLHALDVVGNVNMSGVIGIGTGTPTTGIGINSKYEISANATRYGIYNDLTISSSPLSGNRTYYGIFNDVSSDLTTAHRGTYSSTLYGAYNRARGATVAGTEGSATTLAGSYNYALEQSSSTTTLANGFGSYNYFQNTGSGNVTNAYGIYGLARNNNASSTISNAYGGRFAVSQLSGTITNGYGVFIEDVGGTNQYGLYQSHSSDTNYFAGKVGIGTTDPGNMLDVSKSQNDQTVVSVSNQHTTATGAHAFFHARNDKSGISIGIQGSANNNTGLGNPGDSYIYNARGSAVGKNLNIINNQSGKIQFYTDSTANETERLVIDNVGNVGIGTTTPTSILEVNGDVEVGREGIAGQYNSSQVQGIWSIGDAYRIDTTANNFGGQYGMVYAHTNAGVGIASKLPISGWGHQILFTTAGTPKAAISLSYGNAYFAGNVGIGTDTPTTLLQVGDGIFIGEGGVSGDANIGSDIKFTNTGLISAESNIHVHIDSNNDTTGAYFRITKDSEVTGTGTAVFTVLETGNATLLGTLTQSSDVRLKKNIVGVRSGLETIEKLRGVTYEWKDEEQEKGKQYGFIAQEIEKVIPELVSVDDEGYKSVNYVGVIPVLVEAIKEQQKQINKLEKQIDLLKK